MSATRTYTGPGSGEAVSAFKHTTSTLWAVTNIRDISAGSFIPEAPMNLFDPLVGLPAAGDMMVLLLLGGASSSAAMSNTSYTWTQRYVQTGGTDTGFTVFTAPVLVTPAGTEQETVNFTPSVLPFGTRTMLLYTVHNPHGGGVVSHVQTVGVILPNTASTAFTITMASFGAYANLGLVLANYSASNFDQPSAPYSTYVGSRWGWYGTNGGSVHAAMSGTYTPGPTPSHAVAFEFKVV